jgi:organic radical activating enzyme
VRRLTHADILEVRRTPEASVLLFITDRCPVGCAHCSVDSRPDSPRVTDFQLFGEIVDELCTRPQISMVGISGGEPFVERRALSLATQRMVGCYKRVVIYTSGFWATTPSPPPWIDAILERTCCIYLSTDSYHEDQTGSYRFINAAQAIAKHEVPIIVQVIDQDGMVERAQELLARSFGHSWQNYAEIVPTFGLPHGRGAGIYSWKQRIRGQELGACNFVGSPVIRYDGRVTACCNESVVMGAGPRALRRDCTSGREVSQAVAKFRNDPFCRALSTAGVSALTTQHPDFLDLAGKQFTNICAACWMMAGRSRDTTYEPLLLTMGRVGREDAP